MASVKVEIRTTSTGYQLLRDGRPYVVRGAGIAIDADDAQDMMRALARHGGNSLRTWNVEGGAILDLAHELGLTVALCLDIRRERHGFDYGNAQAVAQQKADAREIVLKYRDHPALLAWVIGNELNHDYTDPRVYDAVNDISKMIHELDPNHPTTSTTADINADLAAVLASRAPDLDFISVQTYGALFDLPEKLRSIGRPVMITEWGTIGHWEVPVTSWGAPLELHSSSKAAAYQRGIDEVIGPLGDHLIGTYAFLWGQKQERTPTWYGTFVDGYATEAVNVLAAFWTGGVDTPLAPVVHGFTLDRRTAAEDIRLQPGREYAAMAHIEDPEGAVLQYRWELMEESQAKQSGGDAEEVPPVLQGLIKPSANEAVLRTPDRPGPYRLFVYATDEQRGIAHANIPFYVANPGETGEQ